MSVSQVRLPISSTRKSAIRFAKLLCRVRPAAANGFQFEGRILRPGGAIPEDELPEPAIVLEGAGSDGSGKKNSPYLYVLWRYDRAKQDWQEIARAWSESWHWALDLGPIAERALKPCQPVPDVRAVAERLTKLIDTEMEPLEPRMRAQLASVLHDRFATRIVADWTTAVA